MIGGTALAIGTMPVIIVGGTVITGTTIASVAGTGALMAGTVGMAAGLTEVRTGMGGYSLTGENLIQSRLEEGYTQDADGRWHKPNGQYASYDEMGLKSVFSYGYSTIKWK